MTKGFGRNISLGSTKRNAKCVECGKQILHGGLCDEHPKAGVDVDDTTAMRVRLLPIYLNSLAFFAAENYLNQAPKPGSEEIHGEPTPEEILEYVCGKGVSAKPDKIARRYRETSAADLQIVPDHEFFITKVVEPLQEAQSSYMVGNWIATIALCGVVCEMVTMLMFEIAQVHLTLYGKPLSDVAVQKAVLGMEFAKLPQEGKLKFLLTLGIISVETFKKLDEARDIRNGYMHYYDQKPEQETRRRQALRMIQISVDVWKNMMVAGSSNGAIQLQPWLEEYLIRVGLFAPPAP